MTAECPYTLVTLQWDAPFPLKIARSHGRSGPQSNTWFPGPTQVLNPNGISISSNPNGISIGSAVLAGLTSLADRLTDHAIRLVTIDRIYVRSTAMRSSNTSLIFSLIFKDCYMIITLLTRRQFIVE